MKRSHQQHSYPTFSLSPLVKPKYSCAGLVPPHDRIQHYHHLIDVCVFVFTLQQKQAILGDDEWDIQLTTKLFPSSDISF